MIESVDIVTILGDLSACTTTLDEHAVEGLGIPSIARTPKGNTDDGDWFAHWWLCDKRQDCKMHKGEQFVVVGGGLRRQYVWRE